VSYSPFALDRHEVPPNIGTDWRSRNARTHTPSPKKVPFGTTATTRHALQLPHPSYSPYVSYSPPLWIGSPPMMRSSFKALPGRTTKLPFLERIERSELISQHVLPILSLKWQAADFRWVFAYTAVMGQFHSTILAVKCFSDGQA